MKYTSIYFIIASLLIPLQSLAQRIPTSNKKGIYNNLSKALNHTDKVKLLDLRGQDLDSLPSSIAQFKNLEILLLGDRLRTLWLYPRAWKYKLRLKRLPAGGYAHLQGRGNGKYYLWNNLDHLPNNLYKLTSLRVLDIYGTRISDADGEEVERRLLENNPEVNIIKQAMNSEKRTQAKEYMLKYNIRYW